VRGCFRRIRIRKISPLLDPEEECQPTGSHCCTSWDRAIFVDVSKTRDSVIVIIIGSKGAINGHGTSRREEL